jgi:hypothetical protein
MRRRGVEADTLMDAFKASADRWASAMQRAFRALPVQLRGRADARRITEAGRGAIITEAWRRDHGRSGEPKTKHALS